MLVNFDKAFRSPEMVKARLCVVVSKPIQARPQLVTVVPLSLSEPSPKMPYHCLLDIAFPLPKRWGNQPRWVKGNMIYAASFARTNLLSLGKGANGRRVYQTAILPAMDLARVQRCILHGLGLSGLTSSF